MSCEILGIDLEGRSRGGEEGPWSTKDVRDDVEINDATTRVLFLFLSDARRVVDNGGYCWP